MFTENFQAALRWPLVAQSPVVIGGVTVSCADALAACETLRTSGSTAIRAVLAAARSPLADCDYHAVYRPRVAAARAVIAAPAAVSRSGRRAHRHLAKCAFELAVREQVAAAACRALEEILASFRADERYASAIAQDAVALQGRRGIRRGAVVVRDADGCRGTDDIAA